MNEREVESSESPGLWPLSWPMGLTMLRLLLLPVFLWILLVGVGSGAEANPYRWYAVAVFAVMAITDKLDGYLARRLNQASKIGAILDPLADKLLIACSVILLSFDWIAGEGYRIPLVVVAFIYGKDLIVALGSLVLLSLAGRIEISARPLGKISTGLQLTLILVTLIAPDIEFIGTYFVWLVVAGLWWAVSLVAAASCVDYVLVGLRQYSASRRSPTIQDKALKIGE